MRRLLRSTHRWHDRRLRGLGTALVRRARRRLIRRRVVALRWATRRRWHRTTRRRRRTHGAALRWLLRATHRRHHRRLLTTLGLTARLWWGRWGGRCRWLGLIGKSEALRSGEVSTGCENQRGCRNSDTQADRFHQGTPSWLLLENLMGNSILERSQRNAGDIAVRRVRDKTCVRRAHVHEVNRVATISPCRATSRALFPFRVCRAASYPWLNRYEASLYHAANTARAARWCIPYARPRR